MLDSIDKSKPIFVAGHQGLIGSAFIRRLQSEGHTQVLTRTRAELDLRDSGRVYSFFREYRPEFVVLAAGKVGGIIANRDFPADFLHENLDIQRGVLSAAHDVGVRKLIFFGSSCMYPRECVQPMKEELLLSGKPEPTSLPYAIAKLAGVYSCLAYNRQYGSTKFLPVIPNNAFGPHDDFNPDSSHVLSALLRRFHEAKEQGKKVVTLWGSGKPRREFLFVDDIVDACYFLLNQDVSSIDFPINVGVGEDISIGELGALMARVVGYQGLIEQDISKPDGAPCKLLDNSRLSALGWRAQFSLEEGIRRTYDWYLKNRGDLG